MDGWGIVLILEEVNKARSSNRAEQETGGEHRGDEATCPECTGSYKLHKMSRLDETGNIFVIV